MNEKLRMAQILIEIAETDLDVIDAELWLIAERKLGGQLTGIDEYKYMWEKIQDYGEEIRYARDFTITYLHTQYLLNEWKKERK